MTPSVPVDRSIPELMLGLLVVVVVTTLLVGAWATGTPFGMFTYTWEGTTDLRATADDAGVEQHVATDISAYETVEPNGTVAIILAPDRPYDNETTAAVRSFVDAGGTLIIADAEGTHANTLLSDLDASARINGTPIRDERTHYRSPALPQTNTVGNHSIVAETDGLTLNHGSAVDSGNTTILVQSSGFAYLDQSGNKQLEQTDPMDAHPVVTVESMGGGEVLVVSDPSVFINAMLAHEGNMLFTQGVFAAHDRVIYDVSHTQDVPPLVAAVLYLRGSPAVAAAAGLLVVAGLGIGHRRIRNNGVMTPFRANKEVATNNGVAGMKDNDE